MASLAALPLAAPGKNEPARETGLALSIILFIAATLTRSIGVTLLPALGWSLMRLTGFEERMRSNRRLLLGCLLSLVAMLAFVAWLFFHSMYGGMFTETYSSHGLLRTQVRMAVVRTQELGELTLNIPTSKVPAAGMASLLAGVFSANLPLVLAKPIAIARRKRQC